VPVPYRSGGELATAVLTQATDTSIGDFAAMLPLIREGRVRALAVTSGARMPLAPEIPTMVEAGVPDYDVTTFFGIVAPAGIPDDIVRLLNTTLNDGLTTPEAGIDPADRRRLASRHAAGVCRLDRHQAPSMGRGRQGDRRQSELVGILECNTFPF
jgi:tripartite-type tricarboxylate transporter receptor subunit TctC